MNPVGYALFVALGAIVALLIRRSEGQRLGYAAQPGYRWVGVGCLLGAVVGAKVGMLMYYDFSSDRFDVTNKTVLGALAGGYLLGELTKRLVGVRFSTGDALAVALPTGQAIGRIGCFVGGCCYGDPSTLPWAVVQHGALRHPAPLYEAFACAMLAAILWTVRRRPRPAGHLFHYYLLAYAAIRFSVETVRADRRVLTPWLSVGQLVCLLGAAAVLLRLRFGGAQEPPQQPEFEHQRVA